MGLWALRLVLAGWALYCVVRVFTAPRNAIEVGAEVPAQVPNDFAFKTYMSVREFYLQLSPGHLKYELQGKEMLKDVVIDVWEQAGLQLVKHQYRVAALVPGERMNLVSERSQVRVLGLFRGQTRSEVEFRFRPLAPQQSQLGLTICIVFPNRLRQFLARLFFTEAIWQAHAKQEMQALARLMEQRWAATVAAPPT